MSRYVRLRHCYDAPAQKVWDIAIDFDCLVQATHGLIAFKGLPAGKLHKGQVVDVSVSLFGLLPWQPYRMALVEFDPKAMTFLSDEEGVGVRTWRHRVTVQAEGQGAVLFDDIEIDAGWRTPFVALWARYMYRRRHKPRLAMLSRYSSVA